MYHQVRLWLSRFLILIVTGWNIQAAIFLFLSGHTLSNTLGFVGSSGRLLVSGIALLFIMWNIPYIVAAYNPYRYRISLFEAIAMQAIAFIGETILYLKMSDLPPELTQTLQTYMLFDGSGLVFLCAAAALVHVKTADARSFSSMGKDGA